MDTRPLEVGSDRVVIGFDPEFAEHAERMRLPAHQRVAQHVLSQILKRTVNVEYRAIESQGQADVPADHTADAAEGGPAANDKAGVHKGARTRQDWLKDPVVRKTLEIFNGSIVDIRE